MIRNLVLSMALAAAAFAQGPPQSMGQQPNALVEYLGLTTDQVMRLNNLNRDAGRDSQPMRDQMREKGRALQQALAASNPDPVAVGRATIEMQQLRQRARQTMALAQQNALAVLTADQRSKLTALENAMKLQPAIGEAMRFHLLTPPEGEFGPGDPGGPGFGPGFGFGPGSGGGFGNGLGPFGRGPGGPRPR